MIQVSCLTCIIYFALKKPLMTNFYKLYDLGVCEKVLKEKPYLGDQQGGGGDTSSASSEDSFDIRGWLIRKI